MAEGELIAEEAGRPSGSCECVLIMPSQKEFMLARTDLGNGIHSAARGDEDGWVIHPLICGPKSISSIPSAVEWPFW
jgi:hypothetical protein